MQRRDGGWATFGRLDIRQQCTRCPWHMQFPAKICNSAWLDEKKAKKFTLLMFHPFDRGVPGDSLQRLHRLRESLEEGLHT